MVEFHLRYLDAYRLFTTSVLKSKFRHISMATEYLVNQFEFMTDITHSTPMDFGLRVATYPNLVLFKSGTEGATNTGKEPYSEYLSCQIAKAMELDYVDYGLFYVER